jgi:2-phospho-L-lactate transferase/gluconeogenesis factor (CofD/UPF0052 family)
MSMLDLRSVRTLRFPSRSGSLAGLNRVTGFHQPAWQATVLALETAKTTIGPGNLMQALGPHIAVQTVLRTIRMKVAHRQTPGAFKRFQAATGLQPEQRIVSEVIVCLHRGGQV